jgi:hypothetical protein
MPVFVDAHVHFHCCYQSDSFLDAALRNLARAAKQQRVHAPTGVLLLADPPGWDSLAALRTRSSRPDSRWSVEQLDEEIAIRVNGPEGAALVLVNGYQIPTVERLEVLALCCRADFALGAPMADVARRSLSLGAITVVPWGFGKWLRRRGRLVASYLERVESDMFFLGDSGARLAGTPEPELIRRAREKGIRNLPGSDPFPFPRHQARVGSRGFVLEGELDPRRPAASLAELLSRHPAQPRTFGGGLGPLQFTLSQARMQISRPS